MKLREIKEFLQGKYDKSLFAEGKRVREKLFGKEVYLRGIVEFSNICKEKCLYCGLRCQNSELKRYRLNFDEIIGSVELVKKSKMGTVVLQSGNDPYYTGEFIEKVIKKIRGKYGDDSLAITLSLGERSDDELKRWKDAGANRYLLKVETFDQELYKRMRPGRELKERLKLIEVLMKLGYEVGSGLIIGLPGMTDEILASDILELSLLGLHMIASGPFIPHNKTPLYDYSCGDLKKSLRTISLLRILNPYSNIPSTSAMASLEKDARVQGLIVGANVIMPTVTPLKVRKLYNIYPGKNESDNSTLEDVQKIKQLISSAGFFPSEAIGNFKGKN